MIINIIKQILSTKILLFIIIGLLTLSFFKSDKSINQIETYSCKEEQANQKYLEYTSKQSQFINNCIEEKKTANPDKYIKKYGSGIELSNSYELSQATNECEKQFNLLKENFGKSPPNPTVEANAICHRSIKKECISLFGKCFLIK